MRLNLLILCGLLAVMTVTPAWAEEPLTVESPAEAVPQSAPAVVDEAVTPVDDLAPRATAAPASADVSQPAALVAEPTAGAAPAVVDAPPVNPPVVVPAIVDPVPAVAAEGTVAPSSAGCALVQQGDLAGALTLLTEELSARPEDAEVVFCLGVAQNRLSQRGAQETLKRALREEPENPAVNYELGLYYYRQGVDAEAIDYFETVLDLAPAGPYAAPARDYLRRIDRRRQDKDWGLELRVGGQYDSNVILHGDNQPAVPTWLGPSDWRAVAQLRASLTPYRDEVRRLSLAYGLYQSAHRHLSEFNVTQHLVEVSGSWKISQPLTVSAAYAFEYLLLGNERYDQAHQFMPALSCRFGAAGVSVFAWRWRGVDFTDSRRYPTNSRYDGNQQTLSWSHLLPLHRRLVLLAGYARLQEQTRQTERDFAGDRLQLGARILLPFEMTAEVGGEYQTRDYDGVDPLFSRTRRDTQKSFTLTLTWPLSPRTSLAAGHQLVHNSSNFSPYDYDRSLSSLFATVRF